MHLYQTENLTYYYPEATRPALKDVNLSIGEGEFSLIVGGSGSGKSSLARVLAGLIPDFHGGRFGGRIFFRGREMGGLDRRLLSREVGIVFQDPEKQLVMTSVEAEIAFGLENLGMRREEMVRRVAEVMGFLDLTGVSREFTTGLSGGQKQKLALAAAVAMQPRVLILDEPTSQLDPVAAEDFLNVVKRLNEEMGLSVILIEQRLERCFHLADRVVAMEYGEILFDGRPSEFARWAAPRGIPFVPPIARFFAEVGCSTIPITVKEGRRLIRGDFGSRMGSHPAATTPASGDLAAGVCGSVEQLAVSGPAPGRRRPYVLMPTPGSSPAKAVMAIRNVWFTYPDGKEALQDVSWEMAAGEFAVVLGPNGAGKSTLLKVMAGLLRPGRGRIQLMGREISEIDIRQWSRYVAYLSQNPNDYLFRDTVLEELLFTLDNFGLRDDGVVGELLDRLHLSSCRQVNPRDLSSGERQRVALAAALVTRPRLLLLDEPTRGMDYRLKDELGEMLRESADRGAAVVVVTHDVEFAATHASRVVMMFEGHIVGDGPKHEVLCQSVFYSTQIAKMCRGYADGVLTIPEAMRRFGLAPAPNQPS